MAFHSRKLGRLFVLIIILLMHIVVIIAIDRGLQSIDRKNRPELIAYMTLLSVDKSTSPKAVRRDASPPKIRAADKSGAVRDDENVVTAPEPEIEGQSSPVPVDWDKLARIAAKQAAKDQLSRDSMRSLDSRPSGGNGSDVLNRGRPHSAGSVEHLGGGIYQTWLSSRCYLSSEVDASTGKRYEYKKCIEPQADGSHMFDHLKPEYLKKPVEDICPRNVVNCDHKK